MIDREKHPMGWNLFLDELESAHEHLANLIKEATEGKEYSEEDLRVDLGHIYAHLNRAWYRRNIPEDFPEQDWDFASKFPDDLEPIG